MEMNVHPVKHFGEPNEERTGDDWMQDKQALFSVAVVCFPVSLKVSDNIQVISVCILKEPFDVLENTFFCFLAKRYARKMMPLLCNNKAGACSR